MTQTNTLLVLLHLTFLMSISMLSAQRTCGTMEMHAQQLLQTPQLQQIRQHLEGHTQQFAATEDTLGIIRIPVVVHILYNNEEENIPDQRVYEQIDILNQDFRRLNADTSSTPEEFKSVAADCGIEFYLASVDPYGALTTGITRTYTASTSFSFNTDMMFDASGGKNAWNTARYLNIWVCDIPSLLGFASFPGASSATDGVVVNYQVFGYTDYYISFQLGRTTTHEVGHFLNLYHIWGDGSCGVDDEVADTPMAGGANYTASPCSWPGNLSCDSYDMFQNYMDYSDDGCMNLFTQGQSQRMRALFAPGGLRASLISWPDTLVLSEPFVSGGISIEYPGPIEIESMILFGAGLELISNGPLLILPGFEVQSGATFTSKQSAK